MKIDVSRIKKIAGCYMALVTSLDDDIQLVIQGGHKKTCL